MWHGEGFLSYIKKSTWEDWSAFLSGSSIPEVSRRPEINPSSFTTSRRGGSCVGESWYQNGLENSTLLLLSTLPKCFPASQTKGPSVRKTFWGDGERRWRRQNGLERNVLLSWKQFCAPLCYVECVRREWKLLGDETWIQASRYWRQTFIFLWCEKYGVESDILGVSETKRESFFPLMAAVSLFCSVYSALIHSVSPGSLTSIFCTFF